MAKEELLTTTQVATELKLHINTVWKRIQTGRLRAFKLGGDGQWRIRRADLDAFIGAGGEQRETHIKNISDSSAQAASPAPAPK